MSTVLMLSNGFFAVWQAQTVKPVSPTVSPTDLKEFGAKIALPLDWHI